MKIKREFRYIRYRICRNIYYADQCPTDNRKNYSSIGKNILMAVGLGVAGLALCCVFVLLA